VHQRLPRLYLFFCIGIFIRTEIKDFQQDFIRSMSIVTTWPASASRRHRIESVQAVVAGCCTRDVRFPRQSSEMHDLLQPASIPAGNLDFCADEDPDTKEEIEAWQTLVHVCRRWRGVVFGSPRRLNLRLVCTPETPVRDTLDVWPPLPLVIQGCAFGISGADNIAAALGRSDRVYKIHLDGVDGLLLGKGFGGDGGAIPELTHLELSSDDETAAKVLPDSFLGWIRPASAKTQVGSHSVSGFTETAFVCRSPRPSPPS